MILLAGGITETQKITVIVLCVAILLFAALNTVLVITLQRRNKKLNKKLTPAENAEETAAEQKNGKPSDKNDG